MKRFGNQTQEQRSAGSDDKKIQRGYMFAGLMLLAVIIVILVSALIHRSNDGQSVLAAAPDYVTDHLTVWSGEPAPSPYSFLYARTSHLVSEARYAEIPDLSVGDHEVAILLRMNDGTTRTENAVLTVTEPVMRMEAGTVATAEQMLGSSFKDAVITPPVSQFTELGSYPVTVSLDGRDYPFTLIVQDTTAPLVTIRKNLHFYVNQKLTAEDFVESCEDLSEVEYHFSAEPTTLSEGTHTVQLIATDSGGNSQTYDLTYEVGGDGEAPMIQGVTKMQTVAGVRIDYLRGIKAIDLGDGTVEVKVQEPAGFDIKQPGTYEIVYSANDSAGNIGKETAELVVLPAVGSLDSLTSEDVMRMGDYIVGELKKVTSYGERQGFARAIFDYVQTHMQYVNGTNNDDWQQAAVSALSLGYGDSANYYGLSRLLLTCAEFDNMMVERQSAQEINQDDNAPKQVEWYAPHFWNLVRVNGAWYHFDASPYYGGTDFFLWTDAQIDYFSAMHGNCYERDKSLYPLTPN